MIALLFLAGFVVGAIVTVVVGLAIQYDLDAADFRNWLDRKGRLP